MTMPLCAACNTPIAQPATGRPRLYCSPRCRKAAARARAQTWWPAKGAPAGGAVPVEEAVLVAQAAAAPTDEQVAAAVMECIALAGSLHRLGHEARPRLRWRCEKLAEVLDTALRDLFPGV